jgi:hypothetical protein
MDLGEIGWGGMDWIDLAQDRDQWRALVKSVMNLPVPKNAGKFLSSYTIGGFSRKAQLREGSSVYISTIFFPTYVQNYAVSARETYTVFVFIV